MFKKKNNETMLLVDSMFNSIVGNDEIHDLLKKLLNKLRKLYLKIALKSPNLFAYENHQARIFLQIAIKTSINWQPECDQNNLFIKTLKSTTKSINKSIKADKYESNNFVKYGKDLEKIIIEVNRVRKTLLKEKQLAAKKINEAKQDASKTILTLLKEKELPKLIRYIIEEQWSNVLVLMYLRHSKQSKEYQQQLKFITLLSEISLNAKAKQHSKQNFEYLLDEYKKGLKIVAYKAREIKENNIKLSGYLTSLSNFNSDKLANKITPELDDKFLTSNKPNTNLGTDKVQLKKDILDTDAILVKSTKNTSATIAPVNNLKKSKETQSKVDYQQIVSNLKIGTWFELTDIDNSNTKVKLSWISPVSGKFLFVNTNGIKITNKNTIELIECLKSNQIRIFKSFN